MLKRLVLLTFLAFFGANAAYAAPGVTLPGADVQAFGAKGDSATDDTAATQAAINSLNGNGGEVIFPRGHYCVKSGPLTNSQQGVTLQGMNRQGATVLD